MSRISRRTALRGVLAGSSILVGIPLLESMGRGKGEALAQSLNPKIFGVFFWGGGIPWTPKNDREATAADVDLYTPEGGVGVTPLVLSELLQPLAGVRDSLNVITGLQTDNFSFSQRKSHFGGQTIALTGDKLAYIDRSDLLYSYNRASIDRVVAKDERFYEEAPFLDSVQISAIDRFFKQHSGWNAISMDGPDQPVKPIIDPGTLYRRLFGNVTESPEPTDRTAEHFQSALDAVLDDARDLRNQVGQSDKERLDRHLEGLFEIETRLRADPVVCETPAEPGGQGGDVRARFDLHTEILVAALKCDVTRVFSFMLSGGAHGLRISAAGIQNGPGGTGNHGGLHAGNRGSALGNTRFSMAALAHLLGRMQEEVGPTGDSLLDNAVVYATSEYATGWHHRHEEFPAMLAGSAGGALSGGNHVRLRDGNMCEVQLTALRALGLEFDGWGWSGGETNNNLPILS